MNFQKINFIWLVLLLISINSYGQVGLNKLAQSTMNFQLVSVSPKASGMGDAFFAVGKGSEAIFYNPAGMVETDKTFDITINYTQWIADINYLSVAALYSLGNYGSVGFSLLSVDYGEINGTSLVDPSMQDLYPAGYIDNGLINNVGAYSIGLTYAHAVSMNFLIGGNFRYVGQNLGDNNFNDETNNATKFVFDAGVLYKTYFKGFRFGMALRNFSTSIKREAVEEQLPLTFVVGTAINLWEFFEPEPSDEESLILAVDFMHSNAYSERFNFGLDYKILGMVSFRVGYQTNRDIQSWSAGFGLSTELSSTNIELNYSYSSMEYFDSINRLSLNFAL